MPFHSCSGFSEAVTPNFFLFHNKEQQTCLSQQDSFIGILLVLVCKRKVHWGSLGTIWSSYGKRSGDSAHCSKAHWPWHTATLYPQGSDKIYDLSLTVELCWSRVSVCLPSMAVFVCFLHGWRNSVWVEQFVDGPGCEILPRWKVVKARKNGMGQTFSLSCFYGFICSVITEFLSNQGQHSLFTKQYFEMFGLKQTS